MIFLTLAFLPFIIDFAAAGSAGIITIPPENYDVTWQSLLNFLNTSQFVWLKQRSRPSTGNIECVRWSKTYLNNTDYFYEKWYREGPARKTLRGQHAKLMNHTNKPAMILNTPKKDGQGQLYIMYYWDYNEHCALFRTPVTGTENHKWTQYVWNSRVGNSPVCDNAFEKVEYSSYWIYKSDCLSKR
ncbi:uncharacterized protein LOC119405985 [Rhipicephalus sanguineus]|uniref:uncharacterized protein LOC119405985 n=1 Tax=Rhipicephalus sanguineus TaxID=34632 RepID=UPI0020C58634|nr:uncharacterized protein LOC119405985 [Rhipicephalus sanguineus]